MNNETQYRIYVACLASYNNGVLHGEWIDCDDMTAASLQHEVNKILQTSSHPNVEANCHLCDGESFYPTELDTCPFCKGSGKVLSAEEYAIHDHEGFPANTVGEYSSLSEVAELVEGLESCDNPEALEAFMDAFGSDIKEALKNFEDAYCGEYKSEIDYAYEFIDSTGMLDSMPENMQCYFDYERFSRDLFMDYTMENGHVFRSDW